MTESDLSHWWRSLPIDEQDRTSDAWNAGLVSAIAALGRSELYIDLADDRGRGSLDGLKECDAVSRGRLLSKVTGFRCSATPAAIAALMNANPSHLVQTVDDEVVLTVADTWDDVFLHIEQPEILSSFGFAARSGRWKPSRS